MEDDQDDLFYFLVHIWASSDLHHLYHEFLVEEVLTTVVVLAECGDEEGGLEEDGVVVCVEKGVDDAGLLFPFELIFADPQHVEHCVGKDHLPFLESPSHPRQSLPQRLQYQVLLHVQLLHVLLQQIGSGSCPQNSFNFGKIDLDKLLFPLKIVPVLLDHID